MEGRFMKKTLAIICALLSLAACNKVTPIEEEPSQEASQEFKVNISFSRSNISDDTKASVKTGFVDDDVVFIFFNGVGDSTNPKYLEMKYNGSTWVPTQKNDLGASDLSGAGTKELTAIYLPYGSGYEVAYDGGFTIKDDSGNDYSGHFFSNHVGYTFTENTLSATISLSAVPSDTAGDKLVHFDVSGFASDHTYAMYQDYMKPISLTKIAANGDVSKQVGTMGDAIPGYQDASFMSFSGVLDNSAVNKDDVDFWFSIRDTFDGMFYYRDAGTRKIIEDMYIGLGSRASKWSIATPGVFTASALGEKIIFARSNLSYRGATGGGKPWQLMKYPWSVIETGVVDGGSHPRVDPIPASDVDFGLFGWATSGNDGVNPWENSETASTYYGTHPWDGYCDATPDTTPTWANGHTTNDYSFRDWGKNTIYEYGGNPMPGSWRTPTRDNFQYIASVGVSGRTNTYRFAVACVNGRNGVMLFPDSFPDDGAGFPEVNNLNVVKSNLGYTNNYSLLEWNKFEAAGVVFLPCADYRLGTRLIGDGEYGGYWTSFHGGTYPHVLTIDKGFFRCTNSDTVNHGFSVRLVRDAE